DRLLGARRHEGVTLVTRPVESFDSGQQGTDLRAGSGIDDAVVSDLGAAAVGRDGGTACIAVQDECADAGLAGGIERDRIEQQQRSVSLMPWTTSTTGRADVAGGSNDGAATASVLAMISSKAASSRARRSQGCMFEHSPFLQFHWNSGPGSRASSASTARRGD